MKTIITKSTEFETLIKPQRVNTVYDYEGTVYNRIKALEKSKANYLKAMIIILAAISATLLAAIIF